ncbi:MAG: nucleoside hydrolase [Oscillospiraceae bacterium]|nr:nucleoside hydrolase [Oscillospiraceae bacterium]
MSDKRPIIIDCNSGIDNICAAKLLLGNPHFDIRGICVCHGNSSLDDSVKIIAEFFSGCTGVYAGSAKGLVHSMPRAWQVNKTEKVVEDREYPAVTDTEPAWEFIYRNAVEAGGELELFVAGPLTDIATAVLKYPSVTEYIKCLWYLGGSVKGGNITPCADYNIWQDPHSAEIVFEAGFKKIVMLDSALIKDEGISIGELAADKAGFSDFDMSAIRENTFRGYADTSASAVLACLMSDPESYKSAEMYVLCETQSSSNYGQLIIDWNGRFAHRPNAEIVTRIDAEKLLGDLESFYDQPAEPEEPGDEETGAETVYEPVLEEPQPEENVFSGTEESEEIFETPETENGGEDEIPEEKPMSDLLKELTAEFDSPEETEDEFIFDDDEEDYVLPEMPEEDEPAADVSDSIEHALNMIRNELKDSTLSFEVEEQALKQEAQAETQEYTLYEEEENAAEEVPEIQVPEEHHQIERVDPNEFIEQILREQDEADGSGSLLDDIPEVLKYAEKTSTSSETVFFDLRKYDEENSIDEQ